MDFGWRLWSIHNPSCDHLEFSSNVARSWVNNICVSLSIPFEYRGNEFTNTKLKQVKPCRHIRNFQRRCLTATSFVFSNNSNGATFHLKEHELCKKDSLRSIMWCVYLCLLLVLLKKSVYMHLRSIGYVGGVHRRRHIGFVRYLVGQHQFVWPWRVPRPS